MRVKHCSPRKRAQEAVSGWRWGIRLDRSAVKPAPTVPKRTGFKQVRSSPHRINGERPTKR
jgi:hypothetical protein